jgi:hypothetical protein
LKSSSVIGNEGYTRPDRRPSRSKHVLNATK